MRHMRRRSRTASSGQAIPLLALTLVVLCGMLGLAVDVGIVAHRNTVLHDAADSAADTGAHVLIFGRNWTTPVTDADVWNAMTSTLTMANLTVRNRDSSTPPPDPCNVGYGTNQVALSATYLDMSGTPIAGASGTPIAVSLATSTPPASAWRVQLTLGACQPAAFGGVIGHPRYTVRVDGTAGGPVQGANTPTSTPTPVLAPFVIYAKPQASSPYQTLFAVGSPSRQAGDVVTFHAESKWNDDQYPDRTHGLNGTYGSVSIHDDSFKGCLLPGTTSVTINGLAPFDHGGEGHCDSLPTPGSIVAIPIIDEAYKDTEPCTSMGGYCVHIVGIALVWVSSTDNSTGTIIGNDGPGSDPNNIIELAPPTPTNTPVVG